MPSKLSNHDRENFISILTRMTDTEMNEYIKNNGKKKFKDGLFVFQWDRLKEAYNNKNNKLTGGF